MIAILVRHRYSKRVCPALTYSTTCPSSFWLVKVCVETPASHVQRISAFNQSEHPVPFYVDTFHYLYYSKYKKGRENEIT